MEALIPFLIPLIPSIANMIAGGGASTVVDAVAKVAKSVVGTDDPEAVKAALADPATAEAFRVGMEAETARYTAAIADVQNARATTVQYVQAGSALAWAPVVLSVVILFLVAGVITAVGRGSLPDNGIVTGTALSWATMVVGYWIGSSASSARNGEAIRSLATAPSLGQLAGRAIDAARR